MKVLCIDGDFSLDYYKKNFNLVKEFPKFLKSYTVIGERRYKGGKIGYLLLELNNDFPCYFDSERFVIIKESTEQSEEVHNNNLILVNESIRVCTTKLSMG